MWVIRPVKTRVTTADLAALFSQQTVSDIDWELTVRRISMTLLNEFPIGSRKRVRQGQTSKIFFVSPIILLYAWFSLTLI